MTKTPHKIGDTIEFKTQKGESLKGEIMGRAWFGDWCQHYEVQTPNGARYTVNTQGEAGHMR